MNAMSAPSAAPAGLMPLSLIADHKSTQPPSNVQALQRSGSDKCVAVGGTAKPTANGMEGAGPIPLVSQLAQSTLPPPVPDLTTHHSTNLVINSDAGVQSSATHAYQAVHQNLVKPVEPGSAQEEKNTPLCTSGAAVSSITASGESRLAEETSVTTAHQLYQTSSSIVAASVTTINTTTLETSKTCTISSQQLQLPNSADIQQIVSPDTTSSISPAIVSSNCETAVAVAAPQVIPATPAVEDIVTRGQDTASSTTTPTINEVTASESTKVSHPVTNSDESASSVQISSTQLSPESEIQTVASTSPQKPTTPVVPSNTGGTGSVSTTNPNPPSNLSSVTNTTSQPQNVESSSKTSTQRQAPKRAMKVATAAPAASETSKKSLGDREVSEERKMADKPRRKRLPTQPYQSPIPELTIIAKYRKMKEMNEKEKIEKKPSNAYSDKLIVFYRNEFLAVRNAEGGFYVCQAMQNVYKSSSRIRIRWLSQQPDPSSDVYTPDFYDHTEFDCILTNLNLERVEKDKFRLPQAENRRTESILQRAIDVERGVAPPPADDTLSETHPDGLDLSLYRNEEQLKKRKKGKKKSGRKKESGAGESVKRQTSSTRNKTGTGVSTVSAAAVAKAKKVAAIKRTAAKRVVQAAAARRQASAAAASAPGSNKRVVTAAASTASKVPMNNTSATVKKDKVQTSSTMNKRKASTALATSAVPDKRTRRANPPSQNQNATSTNTQTKTRGNPGTMSSSNSSAKSVTSSTTSGGGGSNAAGSNGTAANTRRTLRNSK